MKPLTPYAPGEFVRFHGPAAGVLTASQVPALFDCLPWFSRYALAAHVSGKAPLVEPNHGRLELGNRMERVGLEMLGEDRGWHVEQVRAYARHDALPLLASPDGVFAAIQDHGWDGVKGQAECKLLTPKRYKEDWSAGPPLYVQLQHQTQFACTQAERGVIVAMIVGDRDFFVEVHDTLPHAKAIARIEREVAAFMAMLARDELPEPDDRHDSTMDALAALFAPDAGREVRLDEPEAAERFETWQQATLDRQAAEKTEEACKRYFTARVQSAGRILVGNSGEITRKQSKVKASTRPETVSTRWSLRDHSAEEVA